MPRTGALMSWGEERSPIQALCTVHGERLPALPLLPSSQFRGQIRTRPRGTCRRVETSAMRCQGAYGRAYALERGARWWAKALVGSETPP
jgi:hypothetical protein